MTCREHVGYLGWLSVPYEKETRCMPNGCRMCAQKICGMAIWIMKLVYLKMATTNIFYVLLFSEILNPIVIAIATRFES